MKIRLNYFVIGILIVVGICMSNCRKASNIDAQKLLGNQSRVIIPEGNKIEFVEWFIGIEENPEVFISLDIPPGSVNEDVIVSLVRGDFFNYSDLEYDEVNGGVDTVICPSFFATDDLDTNIIIWEWRAMAGFLPNNLAFNRLVQLSFTYEEPNLNRYPHKNWVADHFFAYEKPILYRILINSEINPFLVDNKITTYLLTNRSKWEEVSTDRYTIDENINAIDLSIDNFNYLYFMAAQRWVLQRNETMNFCFNLDGQKTKLETFNDDLVVTWQESVDLEEVKPFVDRINKGMVKKDNRYEYGYFGKIATSPTIGEFKSYNQLFFYCSIIESSPGNYTIDTQNIQLMFLHIDGRFTLNKNLFKPVPGTSIRTTINQLGAIREPVSGELEGTFMDKDGKAYELTVGFDILRTN